MVTQKTKEIALIILTCLLLCSCGATRTEVVRGARVPEIKVPEKIELLDPTKAKEQGTLYVTPPKILKPDQNYRAGKDGNAVLDPKDWRLLRDALSSYWTWIAITSRNISDHNKIFDEKKKSESGVREFLKDWTWKFLMLTHDDWLNLLNLHDGKKAFWTTDAFLRCKQLLNNNGSSLSNAGRDKVQRLLEGITMLKAGVPLSQRICCRRDDALKDQWVTIWRNSEPIQLTKSCLILGKTRGIKAPEASHDIKNYFNMWLTGLGKKEAHWRKAIPYAVQIDEFGGTEVICFHSLDKNEFWRIQSKYYDLIMDRFPTATWWVRGSGSMGIGAKIIASKKEGLTQGILALALTFDTSKATISFPNP